MNGLTQIIAHIGYSEHVPKIAEICNPYFAQTGENAMVVPFACPEQHYEDFFNQLFLNKNIKGAVIAIPYKTVTLDLLGQVSRRVTVAGSCNVVRRGKNGKMEGEIFEGEGFIRALRGRGFDPQGKSALVLGCGGVGSAVAAALAEAGIKRLRLHDRNAPRAGTLLRRLQRYHLGLKVESGNNDAHEMDLVVNATPLGSAENDPFPTHVARIMPHALVAEAMIRTAQTPLLQAAAERGCAVQNGMEMVLEQIPLYLDYFGLENDRADTLRNLVTERLHNRVQSGRIAQIPTGLKAEENLSKEDAVMYLRRGKLKR